MTRFRNYVICCIASFVLASWLAHNLHACTGILLKAKDGAVVYGRTMEWGSFDLKSRVVVVPRGQQYTSILEKGKRGKSWNGKYGIVGIDAIEKDFLVDGMNEKGLVGGLFYHPDFAKYQKFIPAKANNSIAPADLLNYILSTCATVAEVKTSLRKVRVVPVVEPAFGSEPAPGHALVTDTSGKAIVIEYLKGELKIFDAPLGVITNAPTYDWHEINLRNYVNLSAVAIPAKKIDQLNFKPLGGGSGMIGLPGDFTPPSRFVRAVAFTQTARKTKDGPETMYELFRILDNFNVPLGAAEGTGKEKTKGMRSSTIWTSAWDTKNKVLYYHTQHNRRVRMVDMERFNFATRRKLSRLPLDKQKKQDIEDVTAKLP